MDDDKEWAFEQMRKDNCADVHEVTHWFYFKKKEDMDRFIVAALDLDHVIRNSWKNTIGEEKWGLVLWAKHDVLSETLLWYYEQHSLFAERFGGTYDGYEYRIDAKEED